MVSDPAELKIPPPRPSVPSIPLPPSPPTRPPPEPTAPSVPFLPAATLFRMVTEESVTWPPVFKIPPPSPAAWPCWIVTLEIDTLPPRTWKTRSRLLPSMMVLVEPLPWMVRLLVMSRSPVALASSPAPAMVSVKVPTGRMILLAPPCASAAWMAERNEMCPVASLPLPRFAATVSSVVLTLNVESTTRPSSPSSLGCIRGALRFPLFCRSG